MNPVSENTIRLYQINWTDFSDNMILNKTTTYVFKVDTESYYNKITNDCLGILSPIELDKANRFKQNIDKKRLIAGRYFVRNILSNMLSINAETIDLMYTPFNKPFVKGIEFNIAHSGKYILVAISSGAIGVDIELIDYAFDYENIIGDIFNTNEIDCIKTSKDKTLSFYTFWTRKEALLKATGEGLIDDLTTINTIDNTIKRGETNYTLLSFKIDDHLAALAVSASKEVQFLNYN